MSTAFWPPPSPTTPPSPPPAAPFARRPPATSAAADDEVRRQDLRRMKAFATGMLVVAAIVFVVARLFEDRAGWISYVRATAEAAMIGGLADWFAVTALFRHPLGLPIPHTAIIPSNKDRIGRTLGRFIQQNFLSPEVVEDRVRDAGVARHVGTWLSQPANAERVAASAAVVIAGVADVLDEDEAADAIEQAIVARVRATPAAPLLATGLEIAVDHGHHRALVDSLLRAAGTYLDDHRGVLRDRIRVESPWWVPEPVDDRIFEKVFVGAKRFLFDLSAAPDHPLRRDLDRRLSDLAERLRTDPELAATWEVRKEELLEHPSVRAWARSLWGELRAWLTASAHDPDSPLKERLTETLTSFGGRLRDDEQLQATVDRWATEAAVVLADQYGESVTEFVAGTVERWDAADTSTRLELQVGRDLQFIRINGTIVGGLAGLVIYSLGQFL